MTGDPLINAVRKLTVDEYFDEWLLAVEYRASSGWRHCQKQFYRKYIQPVIGSKRLQSVRPEAIASVLGRTARAGKSEQTQLHIFNLMRKMFGDAVELFQFVTHNPVLRTLKPKVPKKEAKFLTPNQVRTLLYAVTGKPYDSAIWVQLYLGLRVSEVIALKWSDLDLENGVALICRSYSRKDSWVAGTKIFKNYPKGGKQHRRLIPRELLVFLLDKRTNSSSEFVAVSPLGEMLSYEFYLENLKRYCREAGITEIGTHGLRHSASELYIHHGATEDDIRRLFAHSSPEITARYLHTRGKNLDRVVKEINVFPSGSTTNRPRLPEMGRCNNQ